MKNGMFPFLIMGLFISCDENESSTIAKNSESELSTRVTTISGAVQKGPFINGTNINIFELENDLSQTGNIFTTTIDNGQGSFEVDNIELASNYVNLQANGFYFNEVLGIKSAAPIILNAVSQLSEEEDQSLVNVNILSQLEKDRVEYLIEEGSTFEEAKTQAQNEIFAIFGFNNSDVSPSELLDISQSGGNNAKLLAVSIILQGYRTEAEMAELIANISLDIKEDGVLNNISLGSQLVNHIGYLDLEGIRQNLINRYGEFGIEADIPSFEEYVQAFLESNLYETTATLIDYPEITSPAPSFISSINLLDLERTEYSRGENMSLAATLNNSGASVKIKITALHDLGQELLCTYPNELNDWVAGTYDSQTMSQTFTTKTSGENCNIWFQMRSLGNYLIEYYEMSSYATPTKTKTITLVE